jgi:1,4-dihydroxy-2-naphthoyl-CoA hydrolase
VAAGDNSFEQLMARMPFPLMLGIELQSATADEVQGTMPWREDLCTAGGILHGGALMAFADTLGAVCAFLNLPPGAGTATISSSTNMLRAIRGGTVTGTARPIHAGRSVIAVRTDLHDDERRLVAAVTQAQAVLGGSA